MIEIYIMIVCSLAVIAAICSMHVSKKFMKMTNDTFEIQRKVFFALDEEIKVLRERLEKAEEQLAMSTYM